MAIRTDELALAISRKAALHLRLQVGQRTGCWVRAMVQPRPAIGYAMAAVAATLFAVNGTVSKVALASGISSGRRRDLARGSAQRGGRRGLRRRRGDLRRVRPDRRARRAQTRADLALRVGLLLRHALLDDRGPGGASPRLASTIRFHCSETWRRRGLGLACGVPGSGQAVRGCPYPRRHRTSPVGPLKKPLPAASIYPNWGRRP